jgi:hypothetical protein
VYLKIYLTFIFILLLTIALFICKSQEVQNNSAQNNSHAILAAHFLLTDLCLSTESRHTRHLSQPELIAPFQDAPGYLDHFPSSTFIRTSNLQSHFVNKDSIIVQGSVKNVMKKYDPANSPLNIREDARLDGNAGQAEGRGVNN